MLRISVVNDPDMTRLKLEGKLAHEWVQEARKAWEAVTAMDGNGQVIVDLMEVAFVDDAGSELLARMRHAGAELIGSGPLISALIQEIEDAESETEVEPDAEQTI
jgi:anti-anti-sigma regulatory factor